MIGIYQQDAGIDFPVLVFGRNISSSLGRAVVVGFVSQGTSERIETAKSRVF